MFCCLLQDKFLAVECLLAPFEVTPDSQILRFPHDANQLYHILDADGGGEVTFEEIDPAADELWDTWPHFGQPFWAAILGSRSWTKLWGFGIKPIVQDSAPNPLFKIFQEQRRIVTY